MNRKSASTDFVQVAECYAQMKVSQKGRGNVVKAVWKLLERGV